MAELVSVGYGRHERRAAGAVAVVSLLQLEAAGFGCEQAAADFFLVARSYARSKSPPCRKYSSGQAGRPKTEHDRADIRKNFGIYLPSR
jgi:hypothetical protein